MAQTKYTYSIAGDTANGILAAGALKEEIGSSSIITALDYISSLGDVLDVYMKDALSTGDKTTLDGVVAAHEGVPLEGPPQIVDLFHKTPVQKIPKVSVYKPEGASTTIVTHDWTDPCTWYSQSTRVTGETLTLDVGKTYDFANQNVIDLTHGRMYGENDITGYELKVYDNGVLKTEDTDYTMNYESGKVTFDVGYTVTGPVTADYSFESGSQWVLKPDAGKVLHIEHAEIQFAKNVSMTPVSFEIWVYNPADLPNKIMYQQIVYKNIKDVINAANLGQGFIPAMGILSQDILVFPFNYATVKSLKDSDGAELRVRILNDTAYSGQWATSTFYVLSENL